MSVEANDAIDAELEALKASLSKSVKKVAKVANNK